MTLLLTTNRHHYSNPFKDDHWQSAPIVLHLPCHFSVGCCLHVPGLRQELWPASDLRFVLGLVEAPFLPAVFVVMSCWYKRSELPPRIAILYGGNMRSAAFSGLIAAGITSRMDGVAGRASWSWLFIIEGSMTVVIAILLVPILTDYPLQSKHRFISRELQLIGVSKS